MKDLFFLNPEITFLNFGSFGACPKPVMQEYQRFQLEMERDPVQFIAVRGPELVRQSREMLGNYIGCAGEDLVYTPNPTFAINIVARSINLQPGDEVLSTDLEYGALDKTWKFYCKQKRATYVRQPISLPLQSKEQFIADFWKGYSSRTKAIFISQITSSTGLIFPVKEICEEAKKRGLLTIVDGAHVPGHLPLDLSQLQADVYTGACHKWMMTPKGSSFLYAKKEIQQWLDPLVVSWGYDPDAPADTRFQEFHQFNGTRDFTAYMTIPRALDFMKEHNWPEVAKSCRELVRVNALRFCDRVGAAPLAPLTDEFFGQLFSIPIKTTDPGALKQRLFDEFSIEIPVMPHDDKVYLRYSINAFNTQEDLDRLFQAVDKLL